MTAPRYAIAVRPRQRGFTLVELMVAITLALLVMAGIGQIYTAAKRSYDVQTSLGRLQEVGRYAVELISQDIRRAGYWGLSNMRGTNPAGAVVPDGTCNPGDTTWGSKVQRRIFGLDDALTNYNTCITDQATGGGDVVAVRYANPQLAPPAAGWNNSLYIRTAPLQATLTQNNPALGAVVNFTSTTDHAVMAHAYYVRNADDGFDPCTPAGSGTGYVPELARKFLNNIGRPQTEGLVHGVERLQFQYGLDTDLPQNDQDAWGNPRRSTNQYVDAGAVANWNNVVSVRFWVLVRDECPDASYTNTNTYVMGNNNFTAADNYRRQLYTATVALRN